MLKESKLIRFIGDIGYAEVDRQGNAGRNKPSGMPSTWPRLVSFFKAHEMAHHQLGHFDRNISVQQKEAEADRYAAGVVSPAARSAAQQFFASGRGGSSRHGTSQQRLARVSVSSKASGLNQSGSQVNAASQAVASGNVVARSSATVGNAARQAETNNNSTTSERLSATRSVPKKWIRVIRVKSCR